MKLSRQFLVLSNKCIVKRFYFIQHSHFSYLFSTDVDIKVAGEELLVLSMFFEIAKNSYVSNKSD